MSTNEVPSTTSDCHVCVSGIDILWLRLSARFVVSWRITAQLENQKDNRANMSSKERDEKILEFFRNVLKAHDVNNDDTIPSILAALCRPSDTESVATLVKRFDPENSGKIVWNDEELLLVVALMDVEDANKIEDSIFSVGFKTFAMVTISYTSLSSCNSRHLAKYLTGTSGKHGN